MSLAARCVEAAWGLGIKILVKPASRKRADIALASAKAHAKRKKAQQDFKKLVSCSSPALLQVAWHQFKADWKDEPAWLKFFH